MELYIPSEQDFRRWIKEAVRECFEEILLKNRGLETAPEMEPLLSRKEIAKVLRISLVTLHEWMKQGLPNHKQGGKVYFLQSEVYQYLKTKKKRWGLFDEPALSDS